MAWNSSQNPERGKKIHLFHLDNIAGSTFPPLLQVYRMKH